MGINLKKGEKVSLTKDRPSLSKILIGLGWDKNTYATGTNFDLDASAFLLGENGKVTRQEDFVFYSNLSDPNGSVNHIGDNRIGDMVGDDEQIMVDLKKIPNNVQRVVFTVTIYEAEERKQNFGQVSNAYIRVLNEENNEELLNYDLDEDFSIETAVVFGEIYRHNGEWKFNAIGSGFKGGLFELCKNYGIDV